MRDAHTHIGATVHASISAIEGGGASFTVVGTVVVVAWQATTFVSAALLIGLPVGIVVGRLVWTAFTQQLGTVANPVTPAVRVLLTIPAAVLLANIIAAVPAVIAGRMKPALALRAE